MTQEEKSILLKDLCARLPYGVMVLEDVDKKFDGGCISELVTFTEIKGEKYFLVRNSLTPVTVEEVRPYLRSMSSMTEKEIIEFWRMNCMNERVDRGYLDKCVDCCLYFTKRAIDWLNANHFDHNNLIPLGLAIKVTEEINPYKG